MPSFWLGLLVLMAFVNWFGILPIYDKAPADLGRALPDARRAGRNRRASEVPP